MKKNRQPKLKSELKPFRVFVELRRQGRRQVEFARKYGVSEMTISNAIHGKSPRILERMAVDLGMIEVQRQVKK